MKNKTELIGKMQSEETIKTIADEFLQKLRDTRSPEDFQAMRKKQLEHGGGKAAFGCASHDFGPDPNELMLDVLDANGFLMIEFPKDDAEREYDNAYTDLCNAAWAIAKMKYCMPNELT